MASYKDILQQQQRAQQLVGMLQGKPASVLVAHHAEPTQVTADVCAATPPPMCVGAVNYSQENPAATMEEPMDETALLKRPRDVSDGSDDERGANDAMPKENGRVAAIARSYKRRGRLGEAVDASRAHVTTAAILAPLPSDDMDCPDELPPASAPPPSGATSHRASAFASSTTAAAFPADPADAQDGGTQDNKQPSGPFPMETATCGGSSGDSSASELYPGHREGQWTIQQSKAVRRKARKLAARRPIAQPAAGTCLFRPTDRAASFLTASREVIARELAATPGVSQVRVNTRLNVVAVDAETDECLAALLATQSVAGIAVRAGRPASRGTSRGLVFGVDRQLTVEEIQANIDCEVAVRGVARKADGAVLITFAAPCPPPFVAVYKLLLPVRGCRPRPTQCARCGRLDHVTACCKDKQRCARCGGGHTAQQCPASTPRCTNCSGPHPVTDPRCPRWQHERKVVTAMARAPQPVPRAEAAASVRTEQPPSYAEMARRRSSQQQASRQLQQRPATQGRQQQQQPPATQGRQQQPRKPAGRPPAQPSAQIGVEQLPAASTATGQDQLVPILLALVHSLVGHLPTEDPARLAATAALAHLRPPAPYHG